MARKLTFTVRLEDDQHNPQQTSWTLMAADGSFIATGSAKDDLTAARQAREAALAHLIRLRKATATRTFTLEIDEGDVR